MNKNYFAVYGCDGNHTGNGCGPETIARITKLISVLHTHADSANVVFLGAGNLRYGYRMNFSGIMKQYIIKECRNKREHMPEIILPQQEAWGSLRESIQIRNNARAYGVSKMTIVSSWYHILRLRLIWFLIAKNIDVTFIASPARLKLIDFGEPIKVLWAVILFVLCKMRLVKSYL